MRTILLLPFTLLALWAADSGTIGYNKSTQRVAPTNLVQQANTYSGNATPLSGTNVTIDPLIQNWSWPVTANSRFAFGTNSITDTNLVYTIYIDINADAAGYVLTNVVDTITWSTNAYELAAGWNTLTLTWSGGGWRADNSTSLLGLILDIFTRLDAVEATASANTSSINDLQNQIDGLYAQTGTHATPDTTNPLSPTWTGYQYTVWYGATGTINLPAVANYTGKTILIYNTGAFTITVDPNGTEVIVRDGTVQTGGVSMTLDSGAGHFVALICDGERWITLGYSGTLAQGS